MQLYQAARKPAIFKFAQQNLRQQNELLST